MADGLRIEIDGYDEVLKGLGTRSEKLKYPEPFWGEVGRMLVNSTQHRMEQGIAPDGSPWPASLRVLFEGGKTMMDTLELYGSITYEASASGVAVGTNLIKAALLHYGGTVKPVTADALAFNIGGVQVFAQSVTIPARPFIGLDDDDEDALEQLVATYIETDEVGAEYVGS